MGIAKRLSLFRANNPQMDADGRRLKPLTLNNGGRAEVSV